MTAVLAFCIECGLQLPSTAKFCPACGTTSHPAESGSPAPPAAAHSVVSSAVTLAPGDMEFASFGQRAVAHIIDWFITAGMMVLGVFLVAAVASAASRAFDDPWIVAYTWLVIAGCLTYKPMLEGGSGQTWGKRLVGIRVVQAEDGSDIGYGKAFGRAAAHLLDFGVGLLLPLWDGQRQTIHDKAAGTIVVKDA